MRGLAILGCTGSIGVSALDVAAQFSDELPVVALAAGRNVTLLAEQVRRFRPRLVSVQRDEDRVVLAELLGTNAPSPLEIVCGKEGALAVALCPSASVVLSAMVGAVGLPPTLAALGRPDVTVAIANKESLVVAGKLCLAAAKQSGATIIPVDSEHSAIYQALAGHRREDVARLVITGSGGPFRQTPDLSSVTVEQALNHPTWNMGPKITIDSATLMNKGLEVIEAHWLFGIDPARISVLIHPQSIIHSLVEYVDGSMVAQMGIPDMRLPISYALGHPRRLPLGLPPLDLVSLGQLTFAEPELGRFPCLALARQALSLGGTAPAVLNAANEIAVAAFLERRASFLDIPRLISSTLQAHHRQAGSTLEELLEADQWARRYALTLLPKN